MRILHTSDWHIGRTFFGERVSDHLDDALNSLVDAVLMHGVDVVVIAGDVFDTTMPAAWAFDFLTEKLIALHEAGATVVVTSGNHDSAQRLRFQSRWARESGIYIMADPESAFDVCEIEDEHGPVRFYGIPYLEPALIRHLPGANDVRSQAAAMRWATDQARADLAEHSSRSVLVAHCFAAGVPESVNAEDIERDLTAGGIDVVPLEVLAGFDYVALGHIHGRARLSESIRYSGAPLHYSFSESTLERGAWLVELGADGLRSAEWVPVAVPRPLTRLRGTLDDLIANDQHPEAVDHWVSASLTDIARPADAMARLRRRFPHAVHVEHAPEQRNPKSTAGYAQRLADAPSDESRIRSFLEHTRNGQLPTPDEERILSEVLDDYRRLEAQR